MLFFKPVLGIYFLLSLSGNVLGLPVENSGLVEDRDLGAEKHTIANIGRDTPALPTVAECKAQLNVQRDTALFYSGPGGYNAKARAWAKANNPSLKVLAQSWKDSSWQDKWQADADTSTAFFQICSQAMAEMASGEVWVMLPSDTKGNDWASGTVWADYEYPNLGNDVGSLIRINPDNSNEENIKLPNQ